MSSCAWKNCSYEAKIKHHRGGFSAFIANGGVLFRVILIGMYRISVYEYGVVGCGSTEEEHA